jgi:hypothetical protein
VQSKRVSRPGHRRLARLTAGTLVAVGLGLFAVLVLTAGNRAREPQEVGHVTAVRQLDIGHAESFTLRTTDGRELRFTADPQLNQTPGHLRDHMVYGEPVVVIYRRAGSELLAVRVDDADE